MFTQLIRIDVAEGIDRWYTVCVQPTLFDPVAVICAWGSRQTAWQQTRVLPAESMEAAQALAAKIVAQKQRRGYTITFQADSARG